MSALQHRAEEHEHLLELYQTLIFHTFFVQLKLCLFKEHLLFSSTLFQPSLVMWPANLSKHGSVLNALSGSEREELCSCGKFNKIAFVI